MTMQYGTVRVYVDYTETHHNGCTEVGTMPYFHINVALSDAELAYWARERFAEDVAAMQRRHPNTAPNVNIVGVTVSR